MNQLMLVVVALVAFVYFGGSMVPSVLRQNKQIIVGVAVGMVLCSLFGLRLEGLENAVQVAQLENTRFGRQALTGDPNAPHGPLAPLGH